MEYITNQILSLGVQGGTSPYIVQKHLIKLMLIRME